jgi:hypothetical protein
LYERSGEPPVVNPVISGMPTLIEVMA